MAGTNASANTTYLFGPGAFAFGNGGMEANEAVEAADGQFVKWLREHQKEAGVFAMVSTLMALDEALDQLATLDPPAAELVKLRFFVGPTHVEAAKILGLSRSAVDRAWVFARAWLFQQLRSGETRTRIAQADTAPAKPAQG